MAGEATTYYMVIEFIKVSDHMEPEVVMVTTDPAEAVAKKAVCYQAVILTADEYLPAI
jgi:hypothetical protein